MNGGTQLNIMCGLRPIPGYVNIDMQNLPGVNLQYYIDPYHPSLPWPDSSVECIYWNNGPEHILDINALIQELWRISKNGATWYLLTPGYRDRNSYIDPTHYSHWTSNTLDFYTFHGFDGRRYEPATLSYVLKGDDDHGLEFDVRVIK